MITDLELIFCNAASYSAIIGGNEGEEELIISLSCGQDGATVVIMTAMSVDGGGHVLRSPRANGRPPEIAPRIETPLLLTYISGQMLLWACSGITPTEDEKEKIQDQIRTIVDRMNKTWHITD